MERTLKRLGENVRQARKARGWSQEELAHRSGLAVVQISRVERGVREVRLGTILKLVRALDVSPNELLADLY